MREERRTVTALFADVAGSTALGERFDPEDVREIVGVAVRHMVEVVERFGGTVKDVAGDGVLALFGAPVAHEDDVERAVLAGLEIQRRTAEHAEAVRREHDAEAFGVRVDIETGLVVMGPVGGGSRIEYGATGDVVNTAARLQSHARVGSVLAGSVARAQIETLFAWSNPIPLALKGKAGSILAAEALRPHADASRARRLPGRGAPLVGRDAELTAATAVIDRLAGVGGAMVISGEAGIGQDPSPRDAARRFTVHDPIPRLHFVRLVDAVRATGAGARVVAAGRHGEPAGRRSPSVRRPGRARGARRSRRRTRSG